MHTRTAPADDAAVEIAAGCRLRVREPAHCRAALVAAYCCADASLLTIEAAARTLRPESGGIRAQQRAVCAGRAATAVCETSSIGKHGHTHAGRPECHGGSGCTGSSGIQTRSQMSLSIKRHATQQTQDCRERRVSRDN